MFDLFVYVVVALSLLYVCVRYMKKSDPELLMAICILWPLWLFLGVTIGPFAALTWWVYKLAIKHRK